MKGIKVNKYIKKILSEDEELTKIVAVKNIKAMVLQPTQYPFISFKRKSLEVEYTKDIPTEDKVMVEIICVSNDYTQTIDMAQRVRDILDFHVYKDSKEKVFISQIRMFDVEEDTVEDAFVQTLTFEFRIQDLS